MKAQKAIPLSTVILAAAAVVANMSTLGSAVAQSPLYGEQTQTDKSEDQRPLLLRLFMNRLAERLDLTEVQKAQVRAIMDAELPTIKPLVAQILANRKQLAAINNDTTFNEEQTRALVEQQTETLNNLLVEKERIRHQIIQVLTPEQRATADKIRNKFEARLEKWINS